MERIRITEYNKLPLRHNYFVDWADAQLQDDEIDAFLDASSTEKVRRLSLVEGLCLDYLAWLYVNTITDTKVEFWELSSDSESHFCWTDDGVWYDGYNTEGVESYNDLEWSKRYGVKSFDTIDGDRLKNYADEFDMKM